MINWISRRDLKDATTGSINLVALILVITVALIGGSWYWCTGVPLRGEGTRGWQRAFTIMWRVPVFGVVAYLAYRKGPIAVLGSVGLIAMAVAGFIGAGREEQGRQAKARQAR